MSVGIVGGGLLGLIAGHRLAAAGVPVTVYEASAGVGGLAGTTSLGGVEVDRYYHALTLTDHRVLALAEELGLERVDPLATAWGGLLPRRPAGLDVHAARAAGLPWPERDAIGRGSWRSLRAAG